MDWKKALPDRPSEALHLVLLFLVVEMAVRFLLVSVPLTLVIAAFYPNIMALVDKTYGKEWKKWKSNTKP